MLPGKKYTPADLLGIVRRRKWLILVPAIVGVAAAVFAVTRVPRLYRSESLIMVVPQRISEAYVTPTDTTRIQDRLASLSDQVRSRSRLEQLILSLNVYPAQRANGIMEDVVRKMSDDIDIDIDRRGDSFRVSYSHTDPRVAQKVTERLASMYIEENMRDREILATSTNQFLETELENARQRLLQQEKKLEEYRRRYSGQLPTQLEANLHSMQSAQVQLQAAAESVNRARERRLLKDRQLADLAAAPVSALPADGPEGQPTALTTVQQLERAQAALARVKLRFTASHPDVRAFERTIRELEQKVAEEASRPANAPTTPISSPELARRQQMKTLEAELAVIDREIASHQAEQARLTGTLRELQGKIDAVPSRESELVELTRDYETLRDSYTSLLRKREDSKLAANLERRQIGVQFRIVDPASLPGSPANLKIHLLVFVGISFAGFLIGIASIALLEYRDTTFKTEDDVARVLSLPVLALVPLMAPKQSRPRKRWGTRTSAATAGALLAAAAIVWRRLQS